MFGNNIVDSFFNRYRQFLEKSVGFISQNPCFREDTIWIIEEARKCLVEAVPVLDYLEKEKKHAKTLYCLLESLNAITITIDELEFKLLNKEIKHAS